MPRYPFKCESCGREVELVHGMAEQVADPSCCKQRMSWVPQPTPAIFAHTLGRDSGFYANDYGVHATEDLTVPGKLQRLQKDGRVPPDPFEEHAAKVRTGEISRYEPKVSNDPLI